MTENNEGTSFPAGQVIELLENEPELLAIAFDQPLKFHARFANLAIGQAHLLLLNEPETELYVLEVVPSEATAEDIGRLLAYMGWLDKTLVNIPPEQTLAGLSSWCGSGSFEKLRGIKGILLACSFSESARCAASGCPKLCMRRYSFSLKIAAGEEG